MFNTLMLIVSLLGPSPVPTPQRLAVVRLSAPCAVLHVQVARSEAQRERGLMGVTHLPAHTGMLFVFSTDGPESFWMKDTLIPLDMVFIASDGQVRKVFARVPVAPLAQADNAIPRETAAARYVLELPAGEAGLDGLRAGAHIGGLSAARAQ